MDHDEIINKRARRIAEDHGCTVAEVNEVLDRHPIELDRDTYLKRTLALERRATLLGLNPMRFRWCSTNR